MKLGLLLACVVAAITLAVGCSDSSDTLTLEEYFAEFEAIDADIDAQVEEAYAVFPEDEADDDIGAFLSDEANLPVFKEFVSSFPRIIGDSVDRMKALEPPSEVEEAHDDLIEAGESAVAAFEEASGVIQAAQTMAEFEPLMNEAEPAIDIAETAFDAACLDLVAAGEANGITVNVTCEDE